MSGLILSSTDVHIVSRTLAIFLLPTLLATTKYLSLDPSISSI